MKKIISKIKEYGVVDFILLTIEIITILYLLFTIARLFLWLN